MSIKPLLMAFSNLNKKGQRSFISGINIPSLYAFYKYLEDELTSAHALLFTLKKVFKAIFKSMDIANCLKIVQLVAMKK